MVTDAVQIRASSLSDLFDCPARWAAKHLRGLRLPGSAATQIGTAVHAGAGAFDQGALDGAGWSIDDTAGAVVDTIWHPAEEVDWEDVTQAKAEKVALAVHRKYCETIAPTQSFVAVEAPCEPLEISDLGIVLTGTTDRVYETGDGALGIADIKTGKTAVDSKGACRTTGHAAQMGVYELLASQSIGKALTAPARIYGLQTGQTATAQRAAVGEIEGASEMLLGTEDEPGLLAMAARLVHSGDFFGNARSMLCGPRFCPIYETCSFRR